MINNKRYQESLDKMEQPINPSHLPEIKMDLAGMSHYAKEKGCSLYQLSEEERIRFLP